MVVGHVAPEAAVGGAIALVQEGDRITIDAERRLLQLEVSETVLTKRRTGWTPPKPRYTAGVLYKYAKQVSSASVPSCSSTISLLIWRPRPLPSPAGLVEKNASQMRFLMSGGMPGPLSVMRTTASPDSTDVSMSRRPSNFIA